MEVPRTTHQQFAVLQVLMAGELAGKPLRERLTQERLGMSRMAFYVFMGRMEKAGLVKGRYRNFVENGQATRERLYRLTGQGEAAHRAVADFYAARINVAFA